MIPDDQHVCVPISDDLMREVRESTGLGLKEAQERLQQLVDGGYPPEAAADALIAAGPHA